MIQSVLKIWIPQAASIVLVSLFVYVAVQQTYRSNANDPQIQIAEEAARVLNNGADPKQTVKSSMTEISSSLLPYTIIYDENGKALASDAVLDGVIPVLPAGVFDFTKTHKEDMISWQPRQGVRSALVVLHCEGPFKGFIVTGRSLRLVEEREGNLVRQIEFCLVFSLAVLLVLAFLLKLVFK